jgi:DNA-binding CsgD family transcriptional regulator
MDAPAGLATVDLAAVRRVVDRMGSQDGWGVRRRDLVGLAGAAGRDHTMTIEAAPGLPMPLVILHRGPPPVRSPLLDGLSPRQREVAVLLAEGLSNRAIARRLRISEGTVKDHVHQVLGGTGCDSRAAFIAAYLTGATAGRTP